MPDGSGHSRRQKVNYGTLLVDLSLLTSEEKAQILFQHFLDNGGSAYIATKFPEYASIDYKIGDLLHYKSYLNDRIGVVKKIKLDGTIRMRYIVQPVEEIKKEEFDNQEVYFHYYSREKRDSYDGTSPDTISFFNDFCVKLNEVMVFSYHDTFNNGKKKKSIAYAFAINETFINKDTEIIEIKKAKATPKCIDY